MHSVETHSIVISETIVLEVTLHFSVGTHRHSNEPPLHVAFISGFIQGVCGTSLAVDGVWRGTHGGLWCPLREDARFEVRVHPRHLQPSTATHIFRHAYHAASSTHRNTHIRPEGVAWAAMSYAGPRTSPSSEAMGSVGPGAAPNLQARWERRRARLRTHIWVRSEPPPLSTPRHRVLRSTYHVQLHWCRLLITGTLTRSIRCIRVDTKAAFLWYFYAAWLHGVPLRDFLHHSWSRFFSAF